MSITSQCDPAYVADHTRTVLFPHLSYSSSHVQFGVYEWCMTDAWDPTNPEHKRIAHGIEVGDGIPEMRSIQNARNALKSVGFQIQHEEDQLRAWLAAIINNPAGRRIIEEML